MAVGSAASQWDSGSLPQTSARQATKAATPKRAIRTNGASTGTRTQTEADGGAVFPDVDYHS